MTVAPWGHEPGDTGVDYEDDRPDAMLEAVDGLVAADAAERRLQMLVQRELDTLRARHEARERFAAERAAAVNLPPLDADTLGQVLARPAAPAHRIDGFLPWAASLLLVAQRKTGKTTLTLNIARALVTGEDLLGRFATRPINGNVALLNYEVSAATVAAWAHEAGIDHDRLLLVNLRGTRNPLATPDDRERLALLLRQHDIESVIVDPFGRAYTGQSQNDAGEVQAWLVALDELVRTHAGALDLILTTHSGWNGERSRGSSALEDWADSIVTLVRDPDDETTRYLRATGRDIDIDEDRLTFDGTTRTLTMSGAGNRKNARRDRALEDLVHHVVEVARQHPGVNVAGIRKQLRADGITYASGLDSKASAEAERRGLVRIENGGRGARLHHPIDPTPIPPSPDPVHEPPDDPFHPLSKGGTGRISAPDPDPVQEKTCPNCSNQQIPAHLAMCNACAAHAIANTRQDTP